MSFLRHRLVRAFGLFWFLPAVMVLFSVALAQALIVLERHLGVPGSLAFVYAGGESGARSLLSAMTGMSIGVAGTLFSITIAALSSVISTMGPRLLHSFLADRGIQATLGIFLATFAFSLFSLRAVSAGTGDTIFIPHYNVSAAMIYAALCVGFLVYYINHMAQSINMTRVVNLLTGDLSRALERGTEAAEEQGDVPRAGDGFFDGAATSVFTERGGYVQQVDYPRLADIAEKHDCVVQLLVRPGNYLLTGSEIARVVYGGDVPEGITDCLLLGSSRDDSQDLEFSVNQLLEVGVRALSPGTNDPFTAMGVIDRFAESLARLENRELPRGVISRNGTLRVEFDVTTFEGLVDTMFHQLRQNATGCTAVYIRLLERLGDVAGIVTARKRLDHLRRHVDLVWDDARRTVTNAGDLEDIRLRYRRARKACARRARGADVVGD
ncbi:DUF2254 domain-containing protein [Corynebacterium sp. P7003]|uniref:DUF2254 domain-containing protein n=1 Tax=Corynebacterium pygosceleis TaxID=2800406 RepID=A0ABT3WTD8_9CORY|nr:DUF2254 domain-containing protein [Corynebacterium pygosceleis]MCX7445363.1 DUF2254 domain-containing protein [Corynebacterium pygosceleis]